MYEYFLLGLVMMSTPATCSSDHGKCESDLLDWFHCWESNVKEGTCTGEQNSAWIPSSKVCNGHEDCPNGEDESIVLCKQHPDRMFSSYFYCATGAVIELSKKCDGKVDCSDGSDEMSSMCQPEKKISRRGECQNDRYFDCRKRKCVPAARQCDGWHDCANGFDESLNVCYQQWHNETQFQCGNGRLIPVEKVCNGYYDCIDGSDELKSVCDTKKNPNKCLEPPAPLSFTLATKYHHGINGTKYVLPNEVVQVQCISSKKLKDPQNGWNVCNVYGKWQFPWPCCKNRKIRNKSNLRHIWQSFSQTKN
ncbi:very low-density lipoprotein receptor-like [Drosophila miranda]|uniref:very low-density lipoprotein receptor-like n=1 Tax=Drosophila miranda TaxID=7229 RepID=UPI0007E8071D|nr:very low-density lipoprotein receptor-like [Drosophila miranda]